METEFFIVLIEFGIGRCEADDDGNGRKKGTRLARPSIHKKHKISVLLFSISERFFTVGNVVRWQF